MKKAIKDFKELLGVMNIFEFYKMFNMLGKIIFIITFPLFIAVWLSWAVICSGAFLGMLMINDYDED